MSELAPIVLFVYNRLEHTIKTIDALRNNIDADKSLLYIFSDSPASKKDEKSVQSVRKYIADIKGFKNTIVIQRNHNMGLANSIIEGVSYVIDKHEKVIVMEDDLITNRYFLKFLNQSLDFYLDNSKIMSVTGYSFPIKVPEDYIFDVYVFYRCMSWGWATWKNRWEGVNWDNESLGEYINNSDFQKKFKRGGDDLYPMILSQFYGKINSWAIKWCVHHSKTNSLCLYPIDSFVKNIGFDGSGVHCGIDGSYNRTLIEHSEINITFDDEVNDSIVTQIQKMHSPKSLMKKIMNRIRNYIYRYFPMLDNNL